MVCLEPYTPDEFSLWYKHLGRLRLFWAKPVVEMFPLYKLAEGCVLKIRWAAEKPRLEEAYVAILRKVKRLDFFPVRGVKIVITPGELDKGLVQQRGGIYIYSTSRPCATGIYLEKVPEGHPEPLNDHIVLASGVEELSYLLYLNKWNFNVDYLWLASPDFLDKAVESALCEARRHGGRYVSVATGGVQLDNIDLTKYKYDYFYNVYRLAF
ncbi:MAG: hypothetical protein QXP31_06165 [Pyrobaculum sp.]